MKVFTGDAVLANAHVTLDNGLIASVTTQPPQVVDGTEIVDGRGQTLLPGLIDAHAHVFPGNLEQAMAFGVTTVLDLMADPTAINSLRRQAGTTPTMADVRTAGTAATVPGGYGWYLVEMGYLPPFPTLTDPAQAEAFVEARLEEGSDYIKILIDDGSTTGAPLPKLGQDTITALVDHAHSRNRLTIAHALNASDAATAVHAGVDVLGHLFVDRAIDQDLPHLLAEHNTAVIPTLAVLDGFFGRPHASELLSDHRIEPYLDTTSRQMLSFGAIPLNSDARYDLDIPRHTLSLLRETGVTILAGSDASNPDTAHGATLHLELDLLVSAGLTPVEALTAATSAPADRFTLSDRGRIAAGLRADLLLVDGDPTSNITNTRDITAVWRGGQRIERTTTELNRRDCPDTS